MVWFYLILFYILFNFTLFYPDMFLLIVQNQCFIIVQKNTLKKYRIYIYTVYIYTHTHTTKNVV